LTGWPIGFRLEYAVWNAYASPAEANTEDTMAKPVVVTDSDFAEKVLKASRPVLVDFGAVWCGPCKMIEPIVDELSTEYDGKMDFTKMDVDASPQTAIQFGIRSIPALLVFKNGKAVAQIVGAVPKAVLRKRIDAVLNSAS